MNPQGFPRFDPGVGLVQRHNRILATPGFEFFHLRVTKLPRKDLACVVTADDGHRAIEPVSTVKRKKEPGAHKIDIARLELIEFRVEVGHPEVLLFELWNQRWRCVLDEVDACRIFHEFQRAVSPLSNYMRSRYVARERRNMATQDGNR